MVRVLIDSFYHAPANNRIGDDIITGGYSANIGRYTAGDCFHPNGIMHVVAELSGEYEFSPLTAPYSDSALRDADILLIANPDYPLYQGASPNRWTPEAVNALVHFIERGGGVLLLVNSFLSRPDYWEENFDIERVSLLFDRIGIRWDANFMSNADLIEPATDGRHRIGYGQGGRILNGVLPAGVVPLLTYEGNIYGCKTEIGQGKLVVLGDAGMISNGLVCFPRFENMAFFEEIFASLRPAWTADEPTHWDFKRYSQLSCAPSGTGMSEALLQQLRPRATFTPDYYYRHLTWDDERCKRLDSQVWKRLPVELSDLLSDRQVTREFQLLSLDAAGAPPVLPVKLHIRRTTSRSGTKVTAIGRAETGHLEWGALCIDPELMRMAGEIERTHLVVQINVELHPTGKPRSAFWNYGQIIYSRNPSAVHYGYEILLSSESGVISPGIIEMS